ncbi:MAG: DUF305 domain-containing protein [Candidatus Moraniibacteriota bacterium]
MKQFSTALVIGLMVVSGIVGIGIGYAYTPEYMLSAYDRNTMDLGVADRWLDLRYINAMIAHHRGAMLLAEQAKQSTRPEIRELSVEILKNEPVSIAELFAWKKAWYGDIRPVADPVVPKLGSYDDTFDLRFLNALIAHHKNGILMTKDVRIKSSRSEILNNADTVEAFLSDSGAMLTKWRSDWYDIK